MMIEALISEKVRICCSRARHFLSCYFSFVKFESTSFLGYNKKMKLAFYFAMGIIFFCSLGCSSSQEPKVCFKDKCFKVEIADTPEERSRGLMFRKKLAPDRGLLFVFESEDKHGFWMKNTYFPLDIVWLNRNKEIVFIKNNFQPCKKDNCLVIYPDKKAKYVLELNTGMASNIGLVVGNKIDF